MKLINTRYLLEEIERLKGINEININLIQDLEKRLSKITKRIDKAINILELSAMNKGICTQIETDTIQHTLLILKGSDKE